jgi:hypothetical protein
MHLRDALHYTATNSPKPRLAEINHSTAERGQGLTTNFLPQIASLATSTKESR